MENCPHCVCVCTKYSSGDGDRMGSRVRKRRVLARLAESAIAAVARGHLPENIQQRRLRRLRQSVYAMRRWVRETRGRLLSSTSRVHFGSKSYNFYRPTGHEHLARHEPAFVERSAFFRKK